MLKFRLLPGTVLVCLMLFFCGDTGNLVAQRMMQADDVKIDGSTKLEIIDSVMKTIEDVYVFPDVAVRMDKYVRGQLKKGAYDEIENAGEFTAKLTEDLRSISHDRHLGVAHLPMMTAEDIMDFDSLPADVKKQRRDQMVKRGQARNFGWNKLEILPGNVGYVKFDGFSDAGYAGQTAVAALNFLGYVDALIIDLRENGGGSPSMVQLISSYFFAESVHLNSFYIRKEDTTKQFWTQAHIEGPRLADVDLYILTSSYTFSAAEEFTYNLKNLERATIIGETTGGGAHPVEEHGFLNLKVGVRVPFGRAVNPITGTNWEGTGIEPDIQVPADQALEVAHLEALKELKNKIEDQDRLASLNWDIEIMDARLNPVDVDQKLLRDYAGSYGPRQVNYKEGALFYSRDGRAEKKLTALSQDTFIIEDVDYFKMKFVRDDDGDISHILGIYKQGHTDRSDRDN